MVISSNGGIRPAREDRVALGQVSGGQHPTLLCRFLHQDYFLPFVVTTMRADMVRHLRFMAVRTLGNGGHRQVVVGPPAILPRFRVSSFWIRHSFSSFLPLVMQRGDSPLLRARQSLPAHSYRLKWAPFEIVSSPHHSSLSEAKGESWSGGAQAQSVKFRLAPQTGHKPRHSLLQITFMGIESITCSVATSANSIPSPE